MLRDFFHTIWFSIREPRRFYATVPAQSSTWGALAYGLVFEMFTALVTFGYQAAFGDAEFRATLAGFPVPPGVLEGLRWSKYASLAFAPFSYLFEVLSIAGMTWIGLRLTNHLRTSFALLVRVFAYASVVKLVGLIGVTGDVILAGFAFIVTFGLTSWYWLVAVRETQGINSWQAMLASLAGGAIALALSCFVGVPLLMLLALWGLTQIDLTKIAP